MIDFPVFPTDLITSYDQAIKLAIEMLGRGEDDTEAKLSDYAYDPKGYIETFLGWSPWSGTEEKPGQQEVLDAYTLSLRQQHEKRRYENEEIEAHELEYWKPNQIIKTWIRVEAGHTVGKTKLAGGMVNHFFDAFAPSIIYTFAPTAKQIHDLLWKEIKSDRRGKGLPGKILDLELKVADNHFATGTAANDSGGKGTERVQGQHNKYLMFVLDEAEGIPEFVYNAVNSMVGGGIAIVLLLANPRTRSSRFHKIRSLSHVQSFRISCLNHPNVEYGREVIPGAVRREYVLSMIENHCEVVEEHDPDEQTFILTFDVHTQDANGTEKILPSGTVFRPNAEFLFRVLGIAPSNITDKTLIPVGRYEAAVKRPPLVEEIPTLRFGVDVARFGKDYGTFYCRVGQIVYRACQFWKQDTNVYAQRIKQEALALRERFPKSKSLHIRVDAGGGFGGGVVDKLKIDLELIQAFPDFRVIEVHFNGTPKDDEAYSNLVTEMYADTAETLKGISLIDPPTELEADLCEREYHWVNVRGKDVKRVEDKPTFRRVERLGRSPDDGDGLIMCVASDRLFSGPHDPHGGGKRAEIASYRAGQVLRPPKQLVASPLTRYNPR